jgi:UDP-GlcNAc:undecaprenyl-phosphate GlcNAc-1-phosphate transferase
MNNFQIPLFQALGVALLISIFFNFFTYKLSNNFVVSNKNKQKRLSDKLISPFGGVASSLAFLLSTRLIGKADDDFILIGTFAVLISMLGLIDDIYNLKWHIKLVFQIFLVAYPLYTLNLFINLEALLGIDFNNYLNFIASTIWIIIIINSINFIDNMDGLAVVVAGSICLQIAFLSNYLNQYKLTDISLLLLTTILGFLIFNFPPAKLYLGDSGSLFIGYCLGFISIVFNWTPAGATIYTSALNPILLFFMIPLLDFLIVVSERIKKGISPTTGGTDHISHRLLALNFSEKKVLLTFLIYSIVCFVLILLTIINHNLFGYGCLFVLISIFTITFIKVKNLKILD